MTVLYVVCEGQTEEAFVKRVLAPHLEKFGVYAIPTIVTTSSDRSTGGRRRGGGGWVNWKADIERLSTQHSRRPDVVFTTFFDLYGMPSDFPNLDVHRSEKNTIRRASALEAEIAKQIDERRLIPYVQRHEFEALVLACLDELDEWLDKADRRGIAKLRAEIDGTAPEDVNDGATTAPSKRILRCIPVFRKSVHGVEACELAGVAKLRARCPRFDAWVAKLEALGSVLP